MHELARLHGRVLVLDRLGHDGRQLGATLAQHAQRVFAVPVEHQDVLDRVGQDARRGRQRTQLLGAAHDHFVEDAVVRVGEDRDRLAAGGRAGNAHRAHHRFGAGVAESHALHAGELGDQPGHLGRQRVLRAHFEAELELLVHRLDHGRRLVAEQVAAEARQQVDVLVAVQVPQAGAIGAVDDDRVDQVLPQRVEAGHHARVGHDLAVLLAERFGLARAGVVACDEVVKPAALGGGEVLLRFQRQPRRGTKGFLDQGIDGRLGSVCRRW